MIHMEPRHPPLPDLHSPRVARAAAAAALGVAERWRLTMSELAQLLGVTPRTVAGWRDEPPATLDEGTLEHISYLLHIYRSGAQLFGRDASSSWLRGPNDGHLFSGAAPLDYMLGGGVQRLRDVHHYLKSVATGAF
jgi:hypothetical protein